MGTASPSRSGALMSVLVALFPALHYVGSRRAPSTTRFSHHKHSSEVVVLSQHGGFLLGGFSSCRKDEQASVVNPEL